MPCCLLYLQLHIGSNALSLRVPLVPRGNKLLSPKHAEPAAQTSRGLHCSTKWAVCCMIKHGKAAMQATPATTAPRGGRRSVRNPPGVGIYRPHALLPNQL